jgi:hypothetical protein
MQLTSGTEAVEGPKHPQPAPAKHAAVPSAIGSALTIISKVRRGQESSLEVLLTEIGENIAENPHIPFAKLTLVHFMRWVLLPAAAPGELVSLAFECNHDGTAEELLNELFREAPLGMDAIYRHVDGYPVSGTAVRADQQRVIPFLLAQRLPYAAFYVGVPGASVQQIRGEEAIRRRVEAYLSRTQRVASGAEREPLALARAALADVQQDPTLLEALGAADDVMPRHYGRLAAGVLAALPLLPGAAAGLVAIRRKEASDAQSSSLAIPDAARALMAREDLQIQNQLTHVVPLKTGRLRALSARAVLKAIDFLAHTWFTKGQLGGISSIHFARWVIIDEGRRLLFFSNYDGSWESYLGDFIDKAAVGLTAVWSNSIEFPESRFLLFKGATDEERFKAWTRSHQVTTQLWYSAYPELTVRNIINNRKVCAGLRRGFRTESDARAWLSRV